MNHFSVLVIGEDVDKQLAPYHEFECTGDDNEFVQDIDETEQAKKEFDGRVETFYRRKSDGEKFQTYMDKFYREPLPEEKDKIGLGSGFVNGISYRSQDWGDGKGYRPKVHFLPEGYEEIKEKPTAFRAFIKDWYGRAEVAYGEMIDKKGEHKYGYTVIAKDGSVFKTVNRTNPNAKWDWYVIGGRWGGFFKPKAGVKGKLGRMSSFDAVMGDKRDHTRADQLLKGQIDIEGMRDEAGNVARKKYQMFAKLFGGSIPVLDMTWEQLEIKHKVNGTTNYEAVREEYWNQPAMRAITELRNSKGKQYSKDEQDLISWESPADYQGGEEAHVQHARDAALSTFAVVKDGKWSEKGKMGWFGASTTEVDKVTWTKKINELIYSLPDDTLLTIVDFHI